MANSQLEFRTTLSPSLADNLLVYRGTPENPENAGTYSVIELKSFLDIFKMILMFSCLLKRGKIISNKINI